MSRLDHPCGLSKISGTHEAANVGDYSYDPFTGRLDTVAGEGLIYDGNGNLERGRDRTIEWTSFNKPRQITKGGTSQYFGYNAERERVLQIAGSKRTVMLDAALQGMAGFSVETDSVTGVKRYQLTVMAGGKPVASIVANSSKDADVAEAEHTNYLHVDRMGTVVMITDEQGKRISRTVFDAWGLRRGDEFGAVSDPFAPDLRHIVGDGGEFDRGFTQHQMLDDVGLIHMNARLYDPVLGRMLSADRIAPEPGHTQGLNRYAYVYNNPFGYTDPSGHSPSTLQQIVGQLIGMAITTVLTPVLTPIGAGAVGGYIGGWISSGGDEDAANAGAFSGVVMGGVKMFAKAKAIQPGSSASVVLNAIASGTISAANDGDFGTGFINGSFGAWVNAEIDGMGVSGQFSIDRIVAQATAGAFQALANGGDPKTGALTAGFGRLFGDSHRGDSDKPTLSREELNNLDGVTEDLVRYSIKAGTGWKRELKDSWHNMGVEPDTNRKYTHSDGREAIFTYNRDGISVHVTDHNGPTYNYGRNLFSHTILDVIPYFFEGAGPNDTSNIWDRVTVCTVFCSLD